MKVELLTPNIAGRFKARPSGVILHGSRSGLVRPIAQEFWSTARYVQLPTHGLGWHATIGEDIYATHMTPRQWGWNAREHSYAYLAVEFAQARLGDPITDGQIRAFVAWWRDWAVPAWPHIDLRRDGTMPTHAELPAGIRDGKSDITARASLEDDEVRRRIRATL